MARALNVFLVCAVLLGGLAASQDYQRADVFGGYSYLNVDTNGLTSRQNLNGWESSLSINLNRWLAGESDFGGYYKGYSADGASAHVSDYGYLFGPRFNFRANAATSVFAHALFGVDHLGASASGYLFGVPVSGSGSQNSFAMAYGGGLQQKVTRHLAIRGGADYVVTDHNIFGGSGVHQNNFRVSVGIAYTFGDVQGQTALLRQPGTVSRVQSPQQAADLALGEDRLKRLGISEGAKSGYGFMITTIAPGSAAEQSGIWANDYIVAVNGTFVHTEEDVASALSTSSGKAVISIGKPTWWLSGRTVQHELVVQ